MHRPAEQSSKVAVVANTGLGDALWMMVVAHAFHKAGSSVIIYSDFLTHLRSLFPHVTIQPYRQEKGWMGEEFDRILFQHHSPRSKERPLPKHARVLYKEKMDLSHSYVWNLQQIALDEAGHAPSEVGLRIPQKWQHRKENKRVVIHPLSADKTKNWRSSQFIKLAKQLQKRGYEPRFILPPSDRDQWVERLEKANLTEPVTLGWMELAQYLYESGYFIGNDASPGHLASLLQIPTLTLFSRKSRAVLYRPDFAPGSVVLPYPWLPGRKLRTAFWQHCLPVSRVLHAFENAIAQKQNSRLY